MHQHFENWLHVQQYGKRMKDYANIPQFLRCVLQNFSLFQLDPVNNFRKWYRLSAHSQVSLFNGSVDCILRTSTEHEREILPTTLPADTGSKSSNTSKPESESCNKIEFMSREKKDWKYIRIKKDINIMQTATHKLTLTRFAKMKWASPDTMIWMMSTRKETIRKIKRIC